MRTHPTCRYPVSSVGIVRHPSTHTVAAQGGWRSDPALGTTHAGLLFGDIPKTRDWVKEEE